MTLKINKVHNRSRTFIDSDIYISGEVVGPEHYIDEFQTLREAKEGEEIRIILNTGGGSLATAVQFVNTMRNCLANITCIIEGECHSAGTLIFLAGHSWVVNPNCLMLIHNYSGGAGGKGSEILQHAMANNDWINKLYTDMYEGFLSEEELTEVLRNQDVWLHSEQIEERLDSVIRIREAKIKEYEERQTKEVLKALTEKVGELTNEHNGTEDSDGVPESPSRK